jgi:hypothetical protein
VGTNTLEDEATDITELTKNEPALSERQTAIQALMLMQPRR